MSLSGPLVELIYKYYSNDELEPHLEQENIEAILKQFEAIKAYSDEIFPRLTLLTDEEIIILTLSIQVPHHTPEKGIIAKDRNYTEVNRALSRFYGINLLLSGEEGYSSFIANQQKDNKFIPVLQKDDYRQLSAKFQGLDTLTLDALKLATLISSIPLNKEARKRADKLLGNYIVDSVEFPALIFADINLARKIYPQVDYLWEKYPLTEDREKLTELLQSAFASRRHYRHMLYTEGNAGMFSSLTQAIRENRLSKQAFDFWVLYWNVNIVGFQGNVSPKGSYYLTANTYKAMNGLETTLDTIFEDPDIRLDDLLKSYLLKRAEYLDLGSTKGTYIRLNDHTQAFLGHIAAMMRLYHPEQGQILRGSYRICRNTIENLRISFAKSEKDMPTPTYAPALFANVKDCLIKRYNEDKIFQATDIIKSAYLSEKAEEVKELIATFETLVLCLPLYLKAMEAYKTLRREGKLDKNIPLSFQAIANPDWVLEMFDKSLLLDKVNILELIEIDVTEKGAVSWKQIPDYQTKLKEQLEKPDFYDDEADHPFTVKATPFTVGYDRRSTPQLGRTPTGEKEQQINPITKMTV